MNVFDTEHPLNLPRPRAGFRNRGWYLYARAVFTAALFLVPFLTALLWYFNITADAMTTGDEPDPFWCVTMAAGVIGLILSILVVSLFWISSWFFRRFKKPVLPRLV